MISMSTAGIAELRLSPTHTMFSCFLNKGATGFMHDLESSSRYCFRPALIGMG
jgi:hypothetical protein